MDVTDLALLLVAVRSGALADMLGEIIRETPVLSDELRMAQARLDALSAEVEQVLLSDVNRQRRRNTENTENTENREKITHVNG